MGRVKVAKIEHVGVDWRALRQARWSEHWHRRLKRALSIGDLHRRGATYKSLKERCE